MKTIFKTRRERPKSAPYLRLKKRKKFFLEKNMNFWKKNFRKKVAQCRKYPLGTLRWYKNYFCASILILLSNNCKILKIVRIVRKVDHSEWDCQLKKTKKKKKKTTHCKSRALFSRKAPTKNNVSSNSKRIIMIVSYIYKTEYMFD